MRTYKSYGKIAFIKTFEIGADHASGSFLVNGNPVVINVNDEKYVDDNWPTQNKEPIVSSLNNGGKLFKFSYPIKKCNACRVEGYRAFIFEFDKNGKLQSVNPDVAF